jgi:hypothetical protein
VIKTAYKKLKIIVLILSLNTLITGCRVRLSFPFLGSPKIHFEDSETDVELYNFNSNRINPKFQNLPNGTVVKMIDGSNYILAIDSYITEDGTKYDYIGFNYPYFDQRYAVINSSDITEVIFYGIHDKNSLEELEEVPDKLLPVGSIVEIGNKDMEHGVLTVIIVGHNASDYYGSDEVHDSNEVYDYCFTLLEQTEKPIYQSNHSLKSFGYINHNIIEKLLYIAPETDFIECLRLKLMEKEEIQGIKTNMLTDEELEECLLKLEGYDLNK